MENRKYCCFASFSFNKFEIDRQELKTNICNRRSEKLQENQLNV